jgi:hypothetical protein
VTKTYPEPIPYGPLSFLPEELEAMRAGKHVAKSFTPGPDQVLRVGNVLVVLAGDRPRKSPPGFSPEELEAVKEGRTIIKPAPPGPRPSPPITGLSMRVVEYRQQGADHVYTFEAV